MHVAKVYDRSKHKILVLDGNDNGDWIDISCEDTYHPPDLPPG